MPAASKNACSHTPCRIGFEVSLALPRVRSRASRTLLDVMKLPLRVLQHLLEHVPCALVADASE